MPIRNNHWYNLNEQRYYPLDDTASARSDNGDLLPNSLLSDMRLCWPTEYGQYAFISAAASTPSLVTVLIEVADTLENSPSTSMLIAGITLPKEELINDRTYTLTPFKPGVGGFIVFGADLDQTYSGRFSSPSQSLLTPRAARPNRLPPVPTIKVEDNAVALSGLVKLTALAPLQLVKETRIINGVEYPNVVVFRLKEEEQNIETTAITESVFATFAGLCGKRTGAKTCNDPQPIQFINGVAPDCDGILTLDFQGCAVIGQNTKDGGITVDCSLGLSTSCVPSYLPRLSDGKLPSEAPRVIITPPLPPTLPIVPDVSISESVRTLLTLPYCDTFDEMVAVGFYPMGDSLFDFISDDSPAENDCCVGALTNYGCDMSVSLSSSIDYGVSYSLSNSVSNSISNSMSHSLSYSIATVPIIRSIEIASSYATIHPNAQARTNISIWTLDIQSLYRKYTTDVKITDGQLGSKKNAGIVINYRQVLPTVINYLVAMLDVDNSTFGIYFFNGLFLVPIATTGVAKAKADDWYRISFTVIPNNITQTSVQLVAVLTGITDSTITTEISTSISANLWQTDAGNAGVYAKRSRSYFSFWRVEEAGL
jgi:hypothetical protein